MEKQLLLVLVCWYFFRSSRFSQPQSVLKDVECTDMHSWLLAGKCLLFAVDCHGLPLVFSSSHTEVLSVWWNFSDWEKGGGLLPFYRLYQLRRSFFHPCSCGKRKRRHSFFIMLIWCLALFFNAKWHLHGLSFKHESYANFEGKVGA